MTIALDPVRQRSRRWEASYYGAVAGAYGGGILAVGFLAFDALVREPFWTPSAVGAAVLGAGGSDSVDLGTVAIYSLIHAALFMTLGALVGRAAVRLRASVLAISVATFAAIQCGVFAVDGLTSAPLLAQIGLIPTLVANALAAFVVAVAFRRWVPRD